MRRKIETVAGATALLGAFFLCTFAFSKKSRQAIWERAGGVSELSGQSTNRMECAHLDHNQKKDYYDDPNNGMLVTIFEHYAHHLYFRDNPHLIGLSKEANEWAIINTWERIFEYENVTPDEAMRKIYEAMIRWANYYRKRLMMNYKEA